MAMTDELIFLVEDAPEGGYTARSLGASIFTEADDLEELREQVRDAVRGHFDEGQEPRVIFFKEPRVISLHKNDCLRQENY
jgi:hypothetical protein